MQFGSPIPTSVTGLAILAVILGALSLISGLAAAGLGLIVVPYSRLAATILLILAPFVFVFGILEIVYGIGFLEGRGWSWTLGMGVSAASLVFSIGAIGLSVAVGRVDVVALALIFFIPIVAIIPIITSSVTIYLLTRPNAKVFFGKGPKP